MIVSNKLKKLKLVKPSLNGNFNIEEFCPINTLHRDNKNLAIVMRVQESVPCDLLVTDH